MTYTCTYFIRLHSKITYFRYKRVCFSHIVRNLSIQNRNIAVGFSKVRTHTIYIILNICDVCILSILFVLYCCYISLQGCNAKINAVIIFHNLRCNLVHINREIHSARQSYIVCRVCCRKIDISTTATDCLTVYRLFIYCGYANYIAA